jgi:hypothetical protein
MNNFNFITSYTLNFCAMLGKTIFSQQNVSHGHTTHYFLYQCLKEEQFSSLANWYGIMYTAEHNVKYFHIPELGFLIWHHAT